MDKRPPACPPAPAPVVIFLSHLVLALSHPFAQYIFLKFESSPFFKWAVLAASMGTVFLTLIYYSRLWYATV